MSLLALSSLSQRQSRSNTRILLWSVCTTLLIYLLQADKGYNLADEGFLWYGVQRVLAGEVPIRDFMSYDPGRYYWSAAIMALTGNESLLALRAASALFQAIGLFIALKLVFFRTEKPGHLLLLPAAVLLSVWMYPWFKTFDIVSSIAIAFGITLLIDKPSYRQYFVLGTVIGLAAIFGRNHGVYGVAASLGAMLFLAIRGEKGQHPIRCAVAWGAGICTGFLPILAMAAVVPGFAAALRQSIVFLLLEQKETNISLPVPWPWLVKIDVLPPWDAAAAVLLGILFIAIVAFGILGLTWSFIQRARGKAVSPVLVTCSLLALPYAHYAFSRADAVHLAQGIFPLLIGVLAIAAHRSALVSVPLAAVLCSASLVAMLPVHAGWQCYAMLQCQPVELGGNRIAVDPRTASDLAMLNKLADAYAPNHQEILVMPFWPGAYSALNRKSPPWEIYALFPRTRQFELAEIERIKAANPGFALVIDAALDDREELRFRNTHPLTYQYIVENFEPVSGYTQEQAYRIYKRKDAGISPRIKP